MWALRAKRQQAVGCSRGLKGIPQALGAARGEIKSRAGRQDQAVNIVIASKSEQTIDAKTVEAIISVYVQINSCGKNVVKSFAATGKNDISWAIIVKDESGIAEIGHSTAAEGETG